MRRIILGVSTAIENVMAIRIDINLMRLPATLSYSSSSLRVLNPEYFGLGGLFGAYWKIEAGKAGFVVKGACGVVKCAIQVYV